MPHRYRGHRANSFIASDINELVEIRARQRTFHGAYSRTALGSFGYSLTILRLFDARFHRIGLIYAVMGALLFLVAFFRGRHAKHDFADRIKDPYPQEVIVETVGQENERVFGPPFVTAGWIVVTVSCMVAAVEVILLILVSQM